MEDANTKFILVTLVVIVIVAASVGFYLIKDAGVEGITALEGKVIADSLATNVNTTAVLYSIRAIDIIDDKGESTNWRYIYGNYTSGIYVTGFEITIDPESNTEIHNISKPITNNFMNNFTIDSPEAISLAKDNSNINSWLNNYPNAHLETIVVTAGENYPIWYLLWSNPGIMDDPHSAVIKLNANTGEVLYIEADN